MLQRKLETPEGVDAQISNLFRGLKIFCSWMFWTSSSASQPSLFRGSIKGKSALGCRQNIVMTCYPSLTLPVNEAGTGTTYLAPPSLAGEAGWGSMLGAGVL